MIGKVKIRCLFCWHGLQDDNKYGLIENHIRTPKGH